MCDSAMTLEALVHTEVRDVVDHHQDCGGNYTDISRDVKLRPSLSSVLSQNRKLIFSTAILKTKKLFLKIMLKQLVDSTLLDAIFCA